MTRLAVEGLARSFAGRPVLEDVSFKTEPGEIVSIIGPSGSGKTTLFRCILGETRPHAGRILVDGVDLTPVPPHRRGVGVVYQNYALFPHLSVFDNVAYGLRVRHRPGQEIREKVRAMLETVRLGGKEDAPPATLSGGEKQRVALARALVVEPKLLLLDEAFTALDATTRGEVVREVKGLVRRFGVTTLLVTHDQEEAFFFGDRVLVLNGGRVALFDEPARVMKARDPFVQDFVKMVLFHEAKVEVDGSGIPFVTAENGAPIPIRIPGVKAGDVVHLMVKKGPAGEKVEVWPADD